MLDKIPEEIIIEILYNINIDYIEEFLTVSKYFYKLCHSRDFKNKLKPNDPMDFTEFSLKELIFYSKLYKKKMNLCTGGDYYCLHIHIDNNIFTFENNKITKNLRNNINEKVTMDNYSGGDEFIDNVLTNEGKIECLYNTYNAVALRGLTDKVVNIYPYNDSLNIITKNGKYFKWEDDRLHRVNNFRVIQNDGNLYLTDKYEVYSLGYSYSNCRYKPNIISSVDTYKCEKGCPGKFTPNTDYEFIKVVGLPKIKQINGKRVLSFDNKVYEINRDLTFKLIEGLKNIIQLSSHAVLDADGNVFDCHGDKINLSNIVEICSDNNNIYALDKNKLHVYNEKKYIVYYLI